MPARLPAAAALGAVLLWSTNAFAAGAVLAHTTVLQLLTVQYGSAAVALLVVRAVVRRPRTVPYRPRRERGVALLIGVAGLTATIFLQYLAFATAPLVGANVLCYADGLIAALWVAAARPSRHTLAGVPLALLGFAGVVVVLTDGGLTDGGSGLHLGYLFALGSAVCMAFYSLAAGRSGASTFDVLVPATVVGAGIAAALSVARGDVWPGFDALAGAVYIGLGPMAAGYALWTYAMAGGRADRLVPLSYATPLLSTALLLVSGRPSGTATLAGTALILVCSAGVLLSQWHHTRRHPVIANRGAEAT